MLLLAACRPFADVAEREAAWYTPAGVAAQGISLGELVDGAPLGHWPRVTLGPDAAGFDNRAWFLTLDEAALRAAPPEETTAALLVEAPGAVPLDDGAFPEGSRRGMLAPALYDAAWSAMDARRTTEDRLGRDLPYPDAVAIVPDAGVPWESVHVALYSALQAGFPAYALVGAHEGHLRGALWGRPAPHTGAWCAAEARVLLGPDGHEVGQAWGPPFADATGACAARDDEAVGAALRALAEGCAPRWRALQAELQTADPTAWACVDVWPSVAPTHTAGPALRSLSALAAPPTIATQGLVGSPDDRLRSCAAAPRLDQLDEGQWDLLCGVDRVRTQVAAERAARASDDPLALLRARGRRPDPGQAAIAAAFPAWVAARPDRPRPALLDPDGAP
jgi:hypothetical protein